MTKQSKLSRYVGDTNFLLGGIRRLMGGIQYLSNAPHRDAEYMAARNDAIKALDRMEKRVQVLRTEGARQIAAQQALEKEKQNGKTSADA